MAKHIMESILCMGTQPSGYWGPTRSSNRTKPLTCVPSEKNPTISPLSLTPLMMVPATPNAGVWLEPGAENLTKVVPSKVKPRVAPPDATKEPTMKLLLQPRACVLLATTPLIVTLKV